MPSDVSHAFVSVVGLFQFGVGSQRSRFMCGTLYGIICMVSLAAPVVGLCSRLLHGILSSFVLCRIMLIHRSMFFMIVRTNARLLFPERKFLFEISFQRTSLEEILLFTLHRVSFATRATLSQQSVLLRVRMQLELRPCAGYATVLFQWIASLDEISCSHGLT